MRQYQPIWEQIKRTKRARLVAPAFNHAKIVQAVMKERSLDTSFRNLLKQHNIRLELVKLANAKKGTLSFKLIRVKNIILGEL